MTHQPISTTDMRAHQVMQTSSLLARRITTVFGMLFLGACSALDISNPSTVEDKSLNNEFGATAMWDRARASYVDALTSVGVAGGLLTDELYFDIDPTSRSVFENNIDRRDAVAMEQHMGFYYALLQSVRTNTDVAIPRLRSYGAPATRTTQIGEMLALRGSATLQLAENVCPGFPLHRVVNFEPLYGAPLTTDEAYAASITELDSALVYLGDSVSLKTFAQLSKARALLGMGKFAEASTIAAMIPSGYVRSLKPTFNYFQDIMRRGFWMASVANREGGNGLDFVSSGDPRVRVTPTQNASFGDITQMLMASDKYPNRQSPIVVASHVEARLIEAEAALNASSSTWLTILNTLRTDGTFTTQPSTSNPGAIDTLWNAGTGGVAGLRPLSDPVDPDGRVDLLFRERAFWLFATGHRLGDLRRMIRFYHRSAETLYPRGTYRTTGVFGTATNLPFDGAKEHSYNPANTGCTER